MFKPGDKVQCTIAKGTRLLNETRIYIIDTVEGSEDYGSVSLENIEGYYTPLRFKLVDDVGGNQ